MFKAPERVVADVAAAEGVGEDPAERDERTVDRFRRETLGAQLGD